MKILLAVHIMFVTNLANAAAEEPVDASPTARKPAQNQKGQYFNGSLRAEVDSSEGFGQIIRYIDQNNNVVCYARGANGPLSCASAPTRY